MPLPMIPQPTSQRTILPAGGLAAGGLRGSGAGGKAVGGAGQRGSSGGAGRRQGCLPPRVSGQQQACVCCSSPTSLPLGLPSFRRVRPLCAQCLMQGRKPACRHGAEYGYPVGAVGPPRIDELYASEIVPRLAPGEHYLDYTGSSLHWNSQIKAAMEVGSRVGGVAGWGLVWRFVGGGDLSLQAVHPPPCIYSSRDQRAAAVGLGLKGRADLVECCAGAGRHRVWQPPLHHTLLCSHLPGT